MRAAIAARYLAVAPLLDERARRLVAGAEALRHRAGRGGGRGPGHRPGAHDGPRGVARCPRRASGLDRGRVRRPGAGRPPIEQRDPTLRADLEALIEPTSRGDPESPLRWTTRSVRSLADELRRAGPRGQPPDRLRAAPRAGLQPAGQPQDPRGRQPPRPRRPVPPHPRGGPAAARPGRAGHQRGHQEEGARGTVPQRGQGAAPQG